MSDESARQRLREAITALKVSASAFAKAGGVTRQALSGYLNTDREPTRDTLAKWVEAYGLDANWLVTGMGEMFIGGEQPDDATLLQFFSKLHEMNREISPLAERVDKLERLMAESGADEYAILLAARAMLDGEILKLTRKRGGYGLRETGLDLDTAAEETGVYAKTKEPSDKAD